MMKLVRIIYRDDTPWLLEDDTKINPEVGTIVQVEDYPEGAPVWKYAIYFPGSQSACIISPLIFELYFEWLG